jgi:hypothetical protein
MHVRCVCNQTFTFCDVQYPHRVSCFVCGRKWMVLEDGSVDQICPKTIRVSCHCGQPFIVHSIEFPRKLRCVTCKRGFSVFDTGEIIDTNEELPSSIPAATAIEDKGSNDLHKSYGSTAFRAKIPKFETREPGRPSKQKPPPLAKSAKRTEPKSLKDELAILDARWRVERMSFALFDSYGIVVFASRRLLAILAVIGVAVSLAAWLWLLNTNNPVRPSLIVMLAILQCIAFFPGVVLLRYVEQYERAEKDWLRQRSGCIKMHHSS